MGASGEFTEAEIGEQVNRILSTVTFKNSRVISRFLEFVVAETLAGKEGEIKEYTIGIHVLSRNIDFNPQLDAIVRTHAGRLRRALKEYYNDSGKDDQVVIEIPKGSYIPVFLSSSDIQRVQTNEKTDPPGKKPIVAVLPFRNIGGDTSRDFFADGLGEQLSTELTWFHELSVISYYSSRHVAGITSDLKEAATLLGAKYLLTGSIQHDNKHLRIRAQLVLGNNGEQLWADSFEKDNTASSLFEIQNDIARNILTVVGGFYGAIFRDVLKIAYNSEANGIEKYDAIFWYYHYQKVFTKEIFQKAIAALEAAVKEDPNFALAWAILGELYLDDKANEFKKIDNPAEEGLKCAQRAVKIDPGCQHAYASLAWVYLFHHNREESLKAANKCIAINPNAADEVGAMGFVKICAGDFDKGLELLNDSVQHNPFYPWWFDVTYVCYFLFKKEYQDAAIWAEKMSRPDLFWDPMMKASAYGHLNRIEDARKNLDLLTQLLPDTANQVKEIIEAFLLSQDLRKEILEGLRKAGLKENETKSKEILGEKERQN